MADAVVTLGARWDGKKANAGIDETKGKIGGLKGAVGRFAAFAKSNAGFLGVSTAIYAVTNALRGMAEEQRTLARLEGQLNRLGMDGARAVANLNDEFVALRRTTMFGDTELAGSLQNLISLTADYRGSVENLGLAADIAADRQISLEQATRLVAFAMKGEFEPLSEINPAIRQWARENRELVGTLEGATHALEMLREQSGGRAAEEMDTLAGAFKRANEGLGELLDATIEFFGIDTGLELVLRAVGDLADKLAELLREVNNFSLNDAFAGTGVDTDAGVISSGQRREKVRPRPRQDSGIDNIARDVTDLSKFWEQWDQEQERRRSHLNEMAGELQRAFEGAFQAMRGGWDDLTSYMRDLLIDKVISLFAGTLVNALLGGGAGPLAGILGLSPVGGSPAQSVGASRAVMQQNAWRMQRSLR